MPRNIFIGRHSSVWANLAPLVRDSQAPTQAISHLDLADFDFQADDRAWLLSYSPVSAENRAMLERLRCSAVGEIVYVSSSSTVVCARTRCYEYPHQKALAEAHALSIPKARILTLGLMHRQADELPAGSHVVTSFVELAKFVGAPRFDELGGRRLRLCQMVHLPFRRPLERWAYQAYGAALLACGSYPCLLRPLDVLLRALGLRWYGYVYLCGRLWSSNTSS